MILIGFYSFIFNITRAQSMKRNTMCEFTWNDPLTTTRNICLHIYYILDIFDVNSTIYNRFIFSYRTAFYNSEIW